MSILDIVGPIIIGPSSSHTAGAARIGRFANRICHQEFDYVEINLYNSFAETGRGHGTDKAILGGILGMDIDDEKLLKSYEIAKKRGIRFRFNWLIDEDLEPNSAKVIFYKDDNISSVTGVSIGGGEVEIRNINGYSVNFNGRYPVLIVIYDDVVGMAAFITKLIADLGINIAFLDIGRDPVKRQALAIINMDSAYPEGEIARFNKNRHIKKVINIERLEE